ncbi:MAG: CoA transferase [Rhodospirillales bacterium]|nr:CoA transferase [Rhodospirillales bacterium]
MLKDFLDGIRVLDLSQFLPGPFATQLLADMGADVLKVEPPAGDPQRRFNPVNGGLGPEGVRSPYYDVVNAGKTIVSIDLKSEDGKQAFEILISSADVLLESYRPGVLERLGFGRERLEELNPGLIHCALSGYGQTGPKRLKAGHDINYIASTGMFSASGIKEKPVLTWPPPADYASAQQAALTILGALIAKQKTEQGTFLDVSLAESMLAWQSFGLTAVGDAQGDPERGQNLLNGGAAAYQVYETGDDRFITLGALEVHFWKNFCEAVGHPEWVIRQFEPLPQTGLIAAVADMVKAQPLEYWNAVLGDVDCCYHPVLDYAEAALDPHTRARGLISKADNFTQVLFPAHVDGEPPEPRSPVAEVDLKTALKRWAT